MAELVESANRLKSPFPRQDDQAAMMLNKHIAPGGEIPQGLSLKQKKKKLKPASIASLAIPEWNNKPAKKHVPAKCKKCGLEIAFKKLPNGKWLPTNPDGTAHWDLCSATIRQGRPFNPLDSRDQQTSGVITGKNYVETNDEGAPW